MNYVLEAISGLFVVEHVRVIVVTGSIHGRLAEKRVALLRPDGEGFLQRYHIRRVRVCDAVVKYWEIAADRHKTTGEVKPGVNASACGTQQSETNHIFLSVRANAWIRVSELQRPSIQRPITCAVRARIRAALRVRATLSGLKNP